MPKPVMSIIVPVFNTSADLLARSMGSILNQSLSEIEVIVVDDGSCAEVASECDRYADSDARIAVYHQKNGGVSRARNAGIEASHAPWVMFVDPDDELIPGVLREGLTLAVEQQLDILYATEIDVREGTRRRRNMGFELDVPLRVLEGHARMRALSEYFVSYEVPKGSGIPKALSTGPVARLFRRDVIGEVRFDANLSVMEDAIFNSEVVSGASRVGLLDRAWYIYYVNPESATNTMSFGDWCERQASAVRMYVHDAELCQDAYYSWVCSLFFLIAGSLSLRGELTNKRLKEAYNMSCFKEAFNNYDINKYEYQSKMTLIKYKFACAGRLRVLRALYSLNRAKRRFAGCMARRA